MRSECSEHQKKIAAYCLGDVSAGEKQAIEAHLHSCPDCSSELEGYRRTVRQLVSIEEEEIPGHFFIYPEEPVSNPWMLFRRMTAGWQTGLACAALLIICLAVAAISRMEIRSNPSGWAITFGKSEIDAAALKGDILEEVDRRNREAGSAWMNAVRSEISRSSEELSNVQKAQFTAALAGIDSRLTGRIKDSEGHVQDDTRVLVSDMYRAVSQQRARDLEAISLRFDSTDATNAIKARQTNEILGTLLQVADLKLR